MKRLSLIHSGLVGVLVMAVVAQASVIDAPHNQTNGINCATCHSYSLWWQYSPTEQSPNSDHAAISDAVCLSCHNAAGSQPAALTHSSAVINSTLHETWGVGCTACHNPHHQEQLSWVGTATEPYLASGTISTVTYNSSLAQSTIVYANATTKPNWPPSGEEEADPDWANKSLANPNRGLILVHDKSKAFNTFSIISATPTQIVVKGELKPEDIDPNYTDPETQVRNSPTCNTFGLIYGQFVKDTIAARQVRFFDPLGGFVEEGAGTTGICQVCHVETSHYTNSGALPSGSDSHTGRDGGNCTTCHKHNAGFKGSGHDGTSFAWAGDCATCHDPDDSVVNISTEIHGRSCGICHLAPGGGGALRDGDPVSGTDGSALGATNASTCVACHEPTAFPSGGIHHNSAGSREHALEHLNTPGITCASCHDITRIPLMADGQPLATTTTCATCHQNGAGDAPNNPTFATSWNDPDYSLGCSDCHDFPPNYAGSPTKANSHASHPFSCGSCHAATSADGATITGPGNHANGEIDVVAGNGASFTYTAAPTGGSCSEVSCHGGASAIWGATLDCLSCHANALGSRVNVAGAFAGNSHHVQGGTLTNSHCYQCHWEAGPEGEITSNHQGTAGGSVDLVVYGAGARPTTLADGVTAVSFRADGSRAELRKLNSHCLGCHSDQNNASQPFADGKTPKAYSTRGESVAARYSQSGFATWGKYPTVGAKKNQKKAYSAHGRTDLNEGGGAPPSYLNTTGSQENVLCFDCHNSHGANIPGVTTSYVSATVNGGILKNTQAGKGGYAMSYQPAAGGRTSGNNAYNPGAGLCFDCHFSASASGNKPWGYSATFGASQPILGDGDTAFFGNSDLRVSHNGGHLGASSALGHQPTGTINGLCTPCHDPHGVSPGLGANQAYAVPLLKGTWLTSPYLEDGPPPSNGSSFAGTYNIDQSTFGWSGSGRITEEASLFAGLCLTCHPVNSLDPDTNNQWKSMDRVHDSVKGWGSNTQHSYSCSKCHGPHSSKHLPRLLVTNCLDYRHKGKVGYNPNPSLTGSSGGFPYGACHQSTNSNAWPDNQGWNIVSPWEDRDEDHAVTYPNQTLATQEDCDDSNPQISRPLDGSCDGDQDGLIDATAGGTDCDDTSTQVGATGCDVDLDGSLSRAVGGYDCDEGNPAISDAADGNCDNDSDGAIDYTANGTDCFDADPNRQVVVDGTCDGDHDGFIDMSTGGGNDCDDNSAAIRSVGDGSCDGDSDGRIDRTAGGPDCDDANAVIGGAADGTCDGDYDGIIDLSAGGTDCDDTNYYISSTMDGSSCDGDTDGAIDWQAGGNDCNDGDAGVKPPCILFAGQVASWDSVGYWSFTVAPNPGWRANLFYGRNWTLTAPGQATNTGTVTGNTADTISIEWGMFTGYTAGTLPHYTIELQ